MCNHLLQATFLLALAVAGRLGTASLAAHQVMRSLSVSCHELGLLQHQARIQQRRNVTPELGDPNKGCCVLPSQVVAQLWLLTAYLVDGFAVAGTVLGSRLAARKDDPAAHRHVPFPPILVYHTFCPVLLSSPTSYFPCSIMLTVFILLR